MFVKIEESEALAKKAGEEKLAKLKATPDDAGFGPNKVVSRLNQNGLQFDAFNLVMNADASKLPAFVGISLPGQGYTIYRINKLSEASPDAARTADLSKQYNDMVASEDLYDYVAMLKAKDGVKILRPLQGTDINR
jgi:peptidyl-prolyl cis-trans isomerase D